jgi:hypothetical protein
VTLRASGAREDDFSSHRSVAAVEMTYLDAAVVILKKSKHPMTVSDITEEAIRRGLIRPQGKTPEATMSAVLYVHTRKAKRPAIRRHFKAGMTRALRDSVRWSYDS